MKKKHSAQPNKTTVPSNNNLDNNKFAVVGIGASAGGLEALQAFFEALPDKLGIAFVVVVHLSPEHRSELASILARHAKIPVKEVSGTMQLEPDCVYVIPPDRHLEITDTHVSARAFEKPRGQRAPIDIFFRSLAKWHGDGYAIILSGGGSDGAIGIKPIKEQGGLILVQDPNEAVFDNMPRSAIATGMADIVLPVRELAIKLGELTRTKQRLRILTDSSRMSKLDDDNETALNRTFAHLQVRTGHDFSKYKRTTVLRRIARRMQVHHKETLTNYFSFLRQNDEEARALFDDLLISVTVFFRDPAAWQTLQEQVISPLLDSLPKETPLRVWVPGCATGEEAYSLAILILDAAERKNRQPDLQIFATDLDEGALAIAREARYPAVIAEDVPNERLQKYFYHEDNHYQAKKELRECVMFATHSLLRDPPFSRLDLISCRNLLIYLNRELQEQIFGIFRYALKPGGYLFLGISENAEGDYFRMIDKFGRLFQATENLDKSPPLLPNLLLSMQHNSHPPLKHSHPQLALRPLPAVHRQLLEDLGPPSLLINKQRQVVHLSESAGRYLQLPGGLPTQDVIALARPELHVELRATLLNVFDKGLSCISSFVPVSLDGEKPRHVAIWACLRKQKLDNSEIEDTFALVVFIESDETNHTVVPGNVDDNQTLQPLQAELQQTKQWLRTATEDYETTNEELRAANEELQSINEEYRSTAEELETSREELQSINEELQTVNSELKNKLDEVSRAHNDLENLMAATEIGTLFLDRHLHIKRFTPRISDLFNIKSSDCERPISDFTHRLNYADLETDVNHVLAELKPIEREASSVNGQYFQVRLRPYRTADDHIDGVVITFIDISKRKYAEEALRTSEERYRLLIDSAREYAIFTMDSNGIITSWNIGAERIFGYSEVQILGQSGAVLYTPESRNARIFEKELQQARQKGSATDDRWHLRQDGKRFWANGVMEKLVDHNNNLSGFVKLLRDNTERKKTEEIQHDTTLKLRDQAAKLRRFDHQKNLFLGLLGHELRNPLAAIRNALQVLISSNIKKSDDPSCNMTKDHLQLIDRQSQHMSQLLDDLLDITRINNGILVLKRQTLLLNEHIREVINTQQADLKARRLQLTTNMLDPSIYLYADPTRIEQVLSNLLGNAIKYTQPGGKIHISISSKDNYGIIKIRDTGIGISADTTKSLFDPFSQIENKENEHKHNLGLGLGLALVKNLVVLHGGTIEVTSDGVNKGTEFCVRLPMTRRVHNEKKSNSMHDQSSIASAALCPRRILLVEDNRDIVEPLAMLLRTQGHQVETAYDGKTGMKIAQKQQPEIAFLDIGIPEMNGFELAHQLRQHFSSEKLTLIALSGYDQKDQRIREAGFNDFLLKPVDLDKITTLLSKLD